MIQKFITKRLKCLLYITFVIYQKIVNLRKVELYVGQRNF